MRTVLQHRLGFDLQRFLYSTSISAHEINSLAFFASSLLNHPQELKKCGCYIKFTNLSSFNVLMSLCITYLAL